MPLKHMEKVSMIEKWVSYELSPENLGYYLSSHSLTDLLKELGWKILPHPPYSPGLVASDFNLLQGLQNHFDGLRLTRLTTRLDFIFQFKIYRILQARHL